MLLSPLMAYKKAAVVNKISMEWVWLTKASFRSLKWCETAYQKVS